jgi:hypothetical protein
MLQSEIEFSHALFKACAEGRFDHRAGGDYRDRLFSVLRSKSGSCAHAAGARKSFFMFLTRHSASRMRNSGASGKLRDRATFDRPAGLECGSIQLFGRPEMFNKRRDECWFVHAIAFGTQTAVKL